MKVCRRCNCALPPEAFYALAKARDGLTSYCRKCHRANVKRSAEKQTPEQRLDRRRRIQHKYRYGITPFQYTEMLTRQQGGCAICGVAPDTDSKPLDVDHDHKTGAIRGLLCTGCNTGLGQFRDDQRLLGLAVLYLAEHDLNTRERSA